MCPSTPKFKTKIQNTKGMILGDEALGRKLDHESRALMDGMCALQKETAESSLAPSTM